MNYQNNDFQKSNIEDTAKLLTKGKRKSRARILGVLLVAIVLIAIACIGLYFFMIRNEKISSDSISKEEFTGVYYTESLYTDKDGESTPGIVEVYEGKIVWYCTEKGKKTDIWQELPYYLEDVDGRTILHDSIGEGYESSVAYFKDLGLIWIGDSATNLFYENNEYLKNHLNYLDRRDKEFDEWYDNNGDEPSYEWKYLEGKWVNKENANDYFTYSPTGDDFIHISYFGDAVTIKEDIESDYSIGDSYDSYSITKVKDAHYEDKVRTATVDRQMTLVPIGENLMVAYLSPYIENGETVWGHGTVFEKISE